MGQAKKMLMDFEEKVSVIDNIINILSSNDFEDLCEPRLISDLCAIRNAINGLDSSSMSVISFISNTVTDDFYSIYSKLRMLMENVEHEGRLSDRQRLEFRQILKELSNKTIRIRKLLQDYTVNRSPVYNSEKYYIEQINDIQSQKNELEKALEAIQKEKRNIQGKSQAEKELHEKRIQDKELQLQIANQQILSYQSELEEKKKQENAILEWNTKIKTTFKELSVYLSPIKNEHDRLKKLYWAYLVLTVIVIVFIAVLEIVICSKFHKIETFPEWKDYLVLMLPIPVTGALLWAFISQLNRAQRQLVILAKHIHEIEYIEGLLLSLNSLSIDINDSMKRVNSAIDRLLDNHLSMGAEHSRYDEESIVKEEKKDMIPSDLILKLLKEIKGIASK